MSTIKDSFESNPCSPPLHTHRNGNEFIKKMEKSNRGTPIPSGTTGGFVKASILLRNAEPTKSRIPSKGNAEREAVVEVSRIETKEAGKSVTRSERLSRRGHDQTVRENLSSATESVVEPQVYSPHFAGPKSGIERRNSDVDVPKGLKSTAPMIDNGTNSLDLNTTHAESAMPAAKPKPRKSPVKRKALTVTEKAVQEFRPEESIEGTLLPYLSPSAKSASDSVGRNDKATVKRKQRGKKTARKSSLLPPLDALDSVQNQKFVFNTASQLQIPSSSPILEVAAAPENAATRPAERMLKRDDSFVDIDVLIGSSKLLGYRPTKALWSAATRDPDGSLMAPETIELSETALESLPAANTSLLDDFDARQDLHEVIDTIVNTGRGRDTVATDMLESDARTKKSIPALPRSLGEASTRQRPTSKSPVKKKRKTREEKPMKPEDDFKKVPLDNLKEELKTYGHKPPRSRKKIIELILLCRALQFQNQTANTVSEETENSVTAALHDETGTGPALDLDLGNPSSNVAILHQVQTVTVSSQPKQRHALRTTPEASENLPPPSFQTPAGPSSSADTDEAQTAMLLSGIHRAIVAQPPTHSIKDPSWKERIAMYDPIILEELTTWLNTGGLDAVGIDTEVWPALVRDWCESKSICFIWASEGWRKKRS